MNAKQLAPGDIVLIPYAPYTNQQGYKRRPCLVISNSEFNDSTPDLFLVPISSVIREGDSRQVIIRMSDPAFGETGLKCSSTVKCGSIFAYSQKWIESKLGIAPTDIVAKVRSIIINIINT